MTNPPSDTPENLSDTSAAQMPAAPDYTHPDAAQPQNAHTSPLPDGPQGNDALEQAVEKKGGAVVWTALIVGALILILLLVFIVQNNQTVDIDYFGWSFNLPLGVAMLLSAVAGVLIAGTIGTVRIVQLSRRLSKIRKFTSR